MRYIRKIKKLEQFKYYFKKIILFAIFFFSFYISSALYFVKFYEDKNLKFSNEDYFIFYFCIIIAIGTIITFIFNLIDKASLLNIILKLKEEISEAEDNCVLVNRDTQELICKYLKERKE